MSNMFIIKRKKTLYNFEKLKKFINSDQIYLLNKSSQFSRINDEINVTIIKSEIL